MAGVGRARAEHLGVVGGVRITRKRVPVRMRHRLEGRAIRVVVRIADEVGAAANLAVRPEAAAELGQRVVEPAVHDRDRDAGAVETELGLGLIGAGEPDGVLHVDSGATRLGAPVRQRDGVDGVDRLDARNRLERRARANRVPGIRRLSARYSSISDSTRRRRASRRNEG